MKKDQNPTWKLNVLYESLEDPSLEKDLAEFEVKYEEFAKKFDTAEKEYLSKSLKLKEALDDYDRLIALEYSKPMLYLFLSKDIDAENIAIRSKYNIFESRLLKAMNKILFFEIGIGKIPQEKQKEFLSDASLSEFRVFLERIFEDAKHLLSVPEETIMNLKVQPAHEMWVNGNQKILNMKTVLWKGKKLPLFEATNRLSQIANTKDRYSLSSLINKTLESVSSFSEAEINSVVTNKKIDDELRKFKTPFESTIVRYRNKPEVVELLVKIVSDNYSISHRFYDLKARLLKLKRLKYADRNIKVGKIKKRFSYLDSIKLLESSFSVLDPALSDHMKELGVNGQIDVSPRIGKCGGAYCSGSYELPTFILLNHTDDLHSFSTLAHELGHAFHYKLSRSQRPIYYQCSTALAETASTFFENFALESIYETLSDKEKIIVLHDRINSDIATIQRQVACFNFEKSLHENIRSKGYLSKEEIARLHNEHMSEYLGSKFKLTVDDGYQFVSWSHIRRFFYVYTYAFGLLVSKALLRNYRKDKNFWKKIEQFLSAGGKASPEEILSEIGIDVSAPGFFMEGLKEISDDIDKLERLANN